MMMGGSSGEYAWVTTVAGEDQVEPALILALSLRRVSTAMKLVAIATPSLSKASKERIGAEFDLLVSTYQEEEEGDDDDDDDGRSRRRRRAATERALKVHGFSLALFEKCVYLGPTSVVIKNCDELFDKEISGRGSTKAQQHDDDHPNLNLNAYIFHPKKRGLSYEAMKTGVADSDSQGRDDGTVPPSATIIPLEDGYQVGVELGKDGQVISVSGAQLDGSIVDFLGEHPCKLWRAGIISMGQLVASGTSGAIKKAIASILSILNDKDSPTAGGGRTRTTTTEPVAIVGMSFRLPGANSAEEFWDILIQGKDAVGPVPPHRWTSKHTHHHHHHPFWTTTDDSKKVEAGFLKVPIDEWDAKFFGISPKEALYIDPQQRLLLEVSWEALEDAGIDPLSLHGTRTGVFVGSWNYDYMEQLRFSPDYDFFRSYMGNSTGSGSGRLAHFLGTTGPCLSAESGCSSSMVGVHLAVQSLRRRESSLALACGVNLILNPFTFRLEEAVLSSDYRCHTFDAAANGYARAEGVATLVLKRLSDAVKDGDRVWGLIRGTGISQEGISNSLGTPTIRCEAEAMSLALRDAGLTGGGDDVDYVEAHGTGTRVGDPKEIAAVAKAYGCSSGGGPPRTQSLIIGSVKTNLGHTESASGIAGMIKVLLAMKHELIPPHRNLETLNPEIDLKAVPAVIPLAARPWPKNPKKRRVAGVSSFGITGTDGHLILEEPPELEGDGRRSGEGGVIVERPLHILRLSAHCPESLELLVAQYLHLLETSSGGRSVKFEDICYSANTGRATFPNQRAVVVAKDCAEAARVLRSRSFPTAADVPQGSRAPICFLFTGQGSQYPGMGSELYVTSPLFRLHFDKVAKILEDKYSISIKEVMWGSSGDGGATTLLSSTLVSQTSIFCVEYALLKLWESWGVTPDYVLGHSLGEFAAAVAAGILELEEALHLVAVRSQLIQDLLPRGKMLVVNGDREEVEEMVARFKSSRRKPTFWADLAALNSRNQTVLAGDSAMMEEFARFCSENGLKSMVLGSSHAFHSRHMDPILEAYGAAVASTLANTTRHNNNRVWPKYISGVEGRRVEPTDVRVVDYWMRHTREKVNFLDACKTAKNEEGGLSLFLEIGPQPVLSALTMRNLEGTSGTTTTSPITALPSLRRGGQDWAVLLDSLGKLHLSGWKGSGSINWKGLDLGYHPRRARVPLPFYPFNRKSVWLQVRSSEQQQQLLQPTLLLHPLLGGHVRSAASSHHLIYENVIHLKALPYLRDHVIGNTIIFPGAAYLEMCLCAGFASAMGGVSRKLLSTPRRPIGLKNLKLVSPMRIPESGQLEPHPPPPPLLQTVVSFDEDDHYSIKICRLDEQDEGVWVSHATGKFLPLPPSPSSSHPASPLATTTVSEIMTAAGATSWDAQEIYQSLARVGLKVGQGFQSFQTGWKFEGGALFKLTRRLPEEDKDECRYLIHPVVADAMLLAALLTARKDTGSWSSKLHVPVSIEEFVWLRSRSSDPDRLILVRSGPTTGKVWLSLMDGEGTPLATMSGVEFVETSVKLMEGLASGSSGARDLPQIWEEVYVSVPTSATETGLQLSGSTPSFEFSAELVAELEQFSNSPEEAAGYADMVEVARRSFLNALHELGWKPQAGETFSTRGLLERLSILERYENYVHFFLGHLADLEILERVVGVEEGEERRFRVSGGEQQPSAQQGDDDPARRIKKFPEADVIKEIGKHLPGILMGKTEPLGLLFPEDRSKPSAALFYQSFSRLHAFPLRRIMESVVLPQIHASRLEPEGEEERSSNSTKSRGVFRILEIGAGTGSSTRILLQILKDAGCIPFEYHFTDVSPAHFAQAEKEFTTGDDDSSRIAFKKLDMEEDPLAQGFSPHSFDMLFAGEVLHVAKDVKQTLRRLRLLLKPGGLFQIIETIVPDPRATFVFGLLPGYWQFEDFDFRRRDGHTTLTGPMWEEALACAAFPRVVVTPTYGGVQGLILAVAGDSSSSSGDLLLRAPPKSTWMMFGGVDRQLEQALEEKLAGLSRKVELFQRDEASHSEVEFRSQVSGLLEQLVSRGLELEGILYLWGLQGGENQDQIRVSLPLLTICQLVSKLGKDAPKIVAVTQGVHHILADDNSSPVTNLSAGTLSGLIKSIKNENCHLKLSQVDLDHPEGGGGGGAGSAVSQLDQLMSTLWGESETTPSILVFRRGVGAVLAPKLVGGWKPANSEYLELPPGCSTRFQLMLPPSRLISELEFTFLEHYAASLEEDEIEMEVKAVGLNFHDVFAVLKPTSAFDRLSHFGLDLAGVVTKVGGGVRCSRKVGDRILFMNLQYGSRTTMPSHVKTKARATLILPERMTFAEGATLPTAFSTATLSLVMKTRLVAGQSVLIHAASGGVGLAAIQIARQVGAGLVIATAGSRRKRRYLRNLVGVEHVFDSRSLDFGKQVLEVTGGRGVDVVLNSLTGPGFKEESLAALAKHGTFVEMSKLNVWSVEEVRERRPDVSYHLVDLTSLEESEYLELHCALERALEQNLFSPIPYERFDGLNIRGALNYMQKAKHIGKIVCVMPELRVVREVNKGQGQGEEENHEFHERTPLFNEHSTYLVTGGLRGIGLEVVRWILRSGGKTVVIASRSSPSPQVREQLHSWNKQSGGSHVQAFQVDIGSYDQVASLIESLPALGFPPLRGVMHAAGVLSDGVLENQSWAKFRQTYNAKVDGSWNLHQLTKGLPLEHFVLFSSITATFGTPGQANHCAANSFMDTLANYRTSLGLPATSVNWANWGEVGVATELDFPGVTPIRTAQGIRALEVFLRTGTRRAAVANITSFPEIAALLPNAAEVVHEDSRRLLLGGGGGGASHLPSSKLKLWNSDEFWGEMDQASSGGTTERLQLFKDLIKTTMRNILRLEESERIEDEADFTSLGMDSLMEIEFKNGLQIVLGCRLAITAADVKEGNTVAQVATRLMKLLEGGAGAASWKSDVELPSLQELKQLIREDSILPENVVSPAVASACLPPKAIDQVKSILLTGVTGNLGPYLLRELSQREGISRVVCLIRKKGMKASPMDRLKTALEKFGLVDEVNMSKVEVLLGNISEARFGLSEREYRVLGESVDAVVHSAARVDHTAKYWRAPPSSAKDNIRTVNILGTLHVLQFCTDFGRVKHLLHASTSAAVATTASESSGGGYSEDWQDVGAFDEMTFNWGYPLTKHVAEQLVRQATERGLPCKAFRFPMLGGDSRTGRVDHTTNHVLLRWLAVLKLGAISDADFPLPYIPVDQAARLSLSVFFNPEAGPDVYSMSQLNPDREEVLLQVAQEEFGIRIRIIPSQEFEKMIEAEDDASPIAPFRRLYTEDQFVRNVQSTMKWLQAYNANPRDFFTCRKVGRFIEDFDEECLEPTHSCMRRDLRYLKEAGVFRKFGIECRT